MVVVLFPMNARYHTRAAWRVSRTHLRRIFKIGWPGGAMWLNEVFCWGYLMTYLIPEAGRAAGHDGDIHNTAGWIALRYMHVSFMPAMGLSIAVTAIVGRCMGMKRPDLAARRAWLGLAITLLYMGACAVVFVLFRRELIALWTPDDLPAETADQLIAIGASVMIAAAVFQLFDAVAIVLSGALRGAGDTVWPGVATIVLTWTCLVLGGHLMIRFLPGLGSIGPWIGTSSYITLLGLFLLVRFIRGAWARIELIDHRVDVGETKPFGDGTISLEAEPLTTPADAAAGVTPGSV
jgi:MATE family multidrug resistance protein